MAELRRVLGLCGGLGEGAEGTERFRRLLLDGRFVSLSQLEAWAGEALERKEIPHLQ